MPFERAFVHSFTLFCLHYLLPQGPGFLGEIHRWGVVDTSHAEFMASLLCGPHTFPPGLVKVFELLAEWHREGVACNLLEGPGFAENVVLEEMLSQVCVVFLNGGRESSLETASLWACDAEAVDANQDAGGNVDYQYTVVTHSYSEGHVATLIHRDVRGCPEAVNLA